jgi:hypothetical protein
MEPIKCPVTNARCDHICLHHKVGTKHTVHKCKHLDNPGGTCTISDCPLEQPAQPPIPLTDDEKIIKAEEGMLSMSCPILGDKCSRECIHFQKGYTYKTPLIGCLDIIFVSSIQSPRCRLWAR